MTVPNPAKAADGKRMHTLDPDPEAAPVVRRIFVGADRNDVDRIAWPDRRGEALGRLERYREGDCPSRHGRPDVGRRHGLPGRDVVKQHMADQLPRCAGQAQQSWRPALVHHMQLSRPDRRECLEVAGGYHHGDAGKRRWLDHSLTCRAQDAGHQYEGGRSHADPAPQAGHWFGSGA
jgi:hypothetical protein